ncbi:MAG: glycosyltransferase family 2 protein [Acidobacteria bacterium]|nr:glycosyltransferase family 2 protein [Acidobacteriota bacterium]
MSLSVVVPVFNEQPRLANTLTALCGYLRRQTWDWEVRVVDDGSEDATVRIAESFARAEPRVHVQREPHRGKGGAVRAGLLAARGAYRFMCDADLSMPVAGISRFLPPALSGFDVAIATREGAAARRIGEPLYRHVMGRLFNYAVRHAALPGIDDSQCGFKMFTAAAVTAIFPLVTVDGWAFDIEVLTIARAHGLRIVQVPVEWHYRDESRVVIARDGPGMLRELLRIRARIRQGRYRPRT